MKIQSLLASAVLSVASVVAIASPASANHDPCGSPWLGVLYQSCAVDQIISNVQLETVEEQYTRYYAIDAEFNDPSSHVEGREEIIAHLENALTQVSIDAIRVISKAFDLKTKTWTVTYEMDTQLLFAVPGTPYVLRIGEPVTLQAATTLRFNAQNKIAFHRDYFDQLAIFAQVPGLTETVFGMVGQFIGQQVCQQISCAPPAP